MKKKNLLALTLMCASVPAMADGFTKASTLLEKVSTGLLALSLVTVTIAVLWVGYKVLFGGNTLRECAPIIIGAILIASASEIARLLVN
ncbi:TrbC/VirB2 family protein [Pseudomonas amygdali pv. morsprunorum]|uniref:TrbC/VirB2 family protein n=1 Tax=Pseudomonas amygdali TaxID=47877 RepID=UPI00288FFA51|nr:TrbC/VirB2 family protein [Pseudomonas amygdali]MDT3268704.1 TrbC/VirB2 family protein [Pseudomonas amygdali pv. morsprunorum]